MLSITGHRLKKFMPSIKIPCNPPPKRSWSRPGNQTVQLNCAGSFCNLPVRLMSVQKHKFVSTNLFNVINKEIIIEALKRTKIPANETDFA